ATRVFLSVGLTFKVRQALPETFLERSGAQHTLMMPRMGYGKRLPFGFDGFFEQNIDSGDVMIEIHASLHKFEGQDQSGPYARPMIVTKRAATASAAATE